MKAQTHQIYLYLKSISLFITFLLVFSSLLNSCSNSKEEMKTGTPMGDNETQSNTKTTNANGRVEFIINGLTRTFFVLDESNINPLPNIEVQISVTDNTVNLYLSDDSEEYFSRFISINSSSLSNSQSIYMQVADEGILTLAFNLQDLFSINVTHRLTSGIDIFNSYAENNFNKKITVAYIVDDGLVDWSQAFFSVFETDFDEFVIVAVTFTNPLNETSTNPLNETSVLSLFGTTHVGFSGWSIFRFIHPHIEIPLLEDIGVVQIEEENRITQEELDALGSFGVFLDEPPEDLIAPTPPDTPEPTPTPVDGMIECDAGFKLCGVFCIDQRAPICFELGGFCKTCENIESICPINNPVTSTVCCPSDFPFNCPDTDICINDLAGCP